MEVYRPSTRDSQQTFVPQLQTGTYATDPRFSRPVGEGTYSSQTYPDEKVAIPSSPVVSPVSLPSTQEQIHAYHTASAPHQYPTYLSPVQGEYDVALPQYPGTPATLHASLAVPPIEPPPRKRGTICGLKRGLFLLVLGLGGVILMAIAIGVGVGVGMGNQKSSAAEAVGSGSQIGEEQPIPPSSVPVTPTSASPSATGALEAAGSCPGRQNTQHAASNGKMFLQLCGVDYSGRGEALDIGHNQTATFAECVELCSEKPDCTGAGWGIVDNDKPGSHTCWMKKNLNQSHTATPSWNFAILLANQPVSASSSPTPTPTRSSSRTSRTPAPSRSASRDD